MNASVLHSLVFFGRLIAGLAVLSLTAPLRASDPRILRIDDADQVQVRVDPPKLAIELGLAAAPAADAQAVLEVALGKHTFDGTPLQRTGGRWRAEFPADSIGALLTCDHLVARFPSIETRPLHLRIPRDRVVPLLGPAHALLGDRPLFFVPPEAPVRPDVPAVGASRAVAEHFVARAWIVDLEWAAYAYRFASARSQARALFLDLLTSGRLPWSGDVQVRLERGYDALKEHEERLTTTREDWRETCRDFVTKWNAAHDGEQPLSVSFASTA